MDRPLDRHIERERALRAAGPRPTPRERPPSWAWRDTPRLVARPTADATNDTVQAYYGGPTLQHAPSFY